METIKLSQKMLKSLLLFFGILKKKIENKTLIFKISIIEIKIRLLVDNVTVRPCVVRTAGPTANITVVPVIIE